MKVGDIVRHKHKGWLGKVLTISTRGPGILVDLSDDEGVWCRVIHRDNLEVINESR